jgi:hypothetical protein
MKIVKEVPQKFDIVLTIEDPDELVALHSYLSIPVTYVKEFHGETLKLPGTYIKSIAQQVIEVLENA